MEAVVVEPGDVFNDGQLELGARAPDAISDQLGLEGVSVKPGLAQFPSAAEIWKWPRVDMTVIYGILFIALALAGFPLWQRVGIAGCTALLYGSIWLSSHRESIDLPMASPAERTASTAGYWCLLVASLFGYMGTLCFGTALIVEFL